MENLLLTRWLLHSCSCFVLYHTIHYKSLKIAFTSQISSTSPTSSRNLYILSNYTGLLIMMRKKLLHPCCLQCSSIGRSRYCFLDFSCSWVFVLVFRHLGIDRLAAGILPCTYIRLQKCAQAWPTKSNHPQHSIFLIVVPTGIRPLFQ